MLYFFKSYKTEDGQFEARCDDIPGVVFGPNETIEALYENLSEGALLYSLQEGFRRRRKAIPLPKSTKGDVVVYVPVRAQAKILLWNTLVGKGTKLADLSRALGVSASQTQKLVDLTKDLASMEAIEKALIAIGGTFDLTVAIKPVESA